ncbi:hypothetical protein MNB_SV-14-1742 [hydrothermal vent metagenome]|uniref:Uncharacterized protein n=1 Tax=hydrothermal vent metagenome TaxID=652676 RepID=A0A1W1CSM2_9ZZZZ
MTNEDIIDSFAKMIISLVLFYHFSKKECKSNIILKEKK